MLQKRLKCVQFCSSGKDLSLIFVATLSVIVINHVFIHESTCLGMLALFCLGLFLTQSAEIEMELNVNALWDNSFPLVF